MDKFSLDQLRGFVSVIEHGSFSRAAERLGLSQPAVSLQVRQLEKRLGTPLIERVGRKARPTAAGAELLTHAGAIESAVTAAVEATTRHATGALGRVRLASGATACIHLLPPLLRALKQKFPKLEIIVSVGNTSDVVKAIEENLIDIALVTLPVSGRMLDVTPVMKDEFVLIAPRDMPLPARITAQALAARPVLLFEPGANTRRITDEWLTAGGATLTPVMSLGSVEAIKELVGAGLGCSILPAMALPAGRRTDLVIRSLSPRLSRTLAVVLRRDKRLSPGLREARKALLSLAKIRG
jgi:DNA-binding transcriptional LysR family regulator